MYNEEILQSYWQTLIHCYTREVQLANIDNMEMIASSLISLGSSLLPHMAEISQVFVNCYREQKKVEVRKNIEAVLTELQKKYPLQENEEENINRLPIHHALAECLQLNIDEQNYTLPHLDEAVQSYETLAESTLGEQSEHYQKKHAETLKLRAKSFYEQGQHEAALLDYKQSYEAYPDKETLIQMALLESELGNYDEAIQDYRLLSEESNFQQQFSELLLALRNLAKMYDELIERDKRRNEIAILSQFFLEIIIMNYADKITNFDTLKELEKIADIGLVKTDVLDKFKEINTRLAPIEKERISARDQAKHLEFLKKQTEMKAGRSSDLALEMLLSLKISEADNPPGLAIVEAAINRWVMSVIKKEDNQIILRNEAGLIELANQKHFLATFYLAKANEEKNILGALSLYARVYLSSKTDQESEALKKKAYHSIESFTRRESGLVTMFSKQQKYAQFAQDLLEVIQQPATLDDPDREILLRLQEKHQTDNDGIRSYNHYVFAVTQLLGIKMSEEDKSQFKTPLRKDDYSK